jgi:hypothetical protein
MKEAKMSMPEEKNALLSQEAAHVSQSMLNDTKFLQDAVTSRQYLEFLFSEEDINIDKMGKYFLKGFISYASRLYSTGEISKEAYVSLLNRAFEIYAERLIEFKVETALEKYNAYLNKALRNWFQ